MDRAVVFVLLIGTTLLSRTCMAVDSSSSVAAGGPASSQHGVLPGVTAGHSTLHARQRAGSAVLHHQQQQQPHQQQQQQQQQLTARSRALQQAEDDPTQRSSWDAVPSYASHYAAEDQRPNMCKVAYRRPAFEVSSPYNFDEDKHAFIPFIGTSVVRDSQLLLLRLYYSIDYPVKWFVVVVGQQMLGAKNAISYQLKHLQEYPQDYVGLVIVTCEHHPAVSESWNAVFQTFINEPWGVYIARDTFWERGALAKLAPHGWQAARTGDVDVGFVTWSNMGAREAVHNIFVMTQSAVKRFGLWDENIHPALCEDLDMMQRMKLTRPPLKEHQWADVRAVHGKRSDKSYWPGAWIADDPNVKEEKDLTHYTVHVGHTRNCNYFLRKWGCPAEAGRPGVDWMLHRDKCAFKTPFNKTVPVWFWHTSKALRARDRWLTLKEVTKAPTFRKQLVDSRAFEVVFEVPDNYATWGGYFDKSLCRLSGFLGRFTGPDGRPMCM